MICRMGDWETLQLMRDLGSELAVSDDFGRTPLHDAFWCPTMSIESVQIILNYDARLLFMAYVYTAKVDSP